MHSALKRDGKPLYDYARAGIERRARADAASRIHAIRVVEGEGDLLDDRRLDAARAPTSARSAKTSARRSAAARTWRRCGRTASGTPTAPRRCTLARLDGLDEAALDALPAAPDALVAAWPRDRPLDDDAGRFLAGVRRRLDLDDAPGVARLRPRARRVPRHLRTSSAAS